MKIYIVTDSSAYEPRAELVYNYCQKNGYDAVLIGTAFDHRKKEKRRNIHIASDADGSRQDCPENGHIYIDAGTYKKNISPARLLYHKRFAEKSYKLLKRLITEHEADCGIKAESKPGEIAQTAPSPMKNAENDGYTESEDLKKTVIYMLLPGNSLAETGARLKKELGVRLIFDIIDLWPESLPFNSLENTFPVKYWKNIRDSHLSDADRLAVECGLYKDIIGEKVKDADVMYWPKKEKVSLKEKTERGDKDKTKTGCGSSESCGKTGESCNDIIISVNTADGDKNEFKAAYLGSINNIIDIPLITNILSSVNGIRHVRLEIIGGGERKDEFLEALKAAGIEHHYHGAIFDEEMKQEILQSCEWGINIMKPGVKVGLTMKSVDYMANGLKLINNIPGDTAKLVEEEKIGVNITSDTSKGKFGNKEINTGKGTDKGAVTEAGGEISQCAENDDIFVNIAKKAVCFDGAEREQIHSLYEKNFSEEAAEAVLKKILEL